MCSFTLFNSVHVLVVVVSRKLDCMYIFWQRWFWFDEKRHIKHLYNWNNTYKSDGLRISYWLAIRATLYIEHLILLYYKEKK